MALNIGPTLGFEGFETYTNSLTFGDMVRFATSLFYDDPIAWHGNDGCVCKS